MLMIPVSIKSQVSAQKERPAPVTIQALINLAITYFRLSTIIGRTGLAAEFGMGSGVSPSVKSPGNLRISPPESGPTIS
jgi:hypothetical protein